MRSPKKGSPDLYRSGRLHDFDTNIKHGTGRAAEIKEWIDAHDVEEFVILDDEDWSWSEYGYDKNWIQSSWFDGGLKTEHIQKAIKILNRKN